MDGRVQREHNAERDESHWLASAAISFVVLALGTVEGVLPLRFASHLDQRAIGILYAASAVVVAASAALAARARPRLLVLGACVLIVAGLGLAGSSMTVPIWIGALIGVGIGNTGAIGLLFEAVGAERIVTAMIIWSQLGILGYLAGPLVGGLAAQTLGYGAIALAPLVLAIPLAVLLLSRRPTESLRPATTSSDGSDAR